MVEERWGRLHPTATTQVATSGGREEQGEEGAHCSLGGGLNLKTEQKQKGKVEGKVNENKKKRSVKRK